MSTGRYLKRVERIFKAYEVFMYKEFDGKRVVEFLIKPKAKSYDKECCFVELPLLQRLSFLLGTKGVTVTGYDMSDENDGTDYVLYFLINGVNGMRR